MKKQITDIGITEIDGIEIKVIEPEQWHYDEYIPIILTGNRKTVTEEIVYNMAGMAIGHPHESHKYSTHYKGIMIDPEREVYDVE